MAASWRPFWLLQAPHRLAFFTAALMLVVSSVWWAVMLSLRSLGHQAAMAIPVSSAHALLMSASFMPSFFAGFLFTAGPKWLDVEGVHAKRLLPGLVLMFAGWTTALAGFHVHQLLAAGGLALVATGWSWLCLMFIRLVIASKAEDRTHVKLAAVACSVGVVTLWLAAIAVAAEATTALRVLTQAAIWWFLAPVFVAVSHRMIPFFGASAVPFLDAWRPMWLLWVMLASLGLEGLFAIAEIGWWPLPTGIRWLQVIVEASAGLLLIWLAARWGFIQSLKIRMLAMLHAGFVWLGLAFVLNAISHTLMALSSDQLSLGLAPLHAMTMGYLGATMFAMTTRVSSGHGGRPVAADSPAWVLYWILQFAVALRVFAALWPALATSLTLVAIFSWVFATTGWSIRYGRWFGQPRADGRPG